MITTKPSQTGKSMSRIRPFVRNDIEQAADLHQRVFGDSDNPAQQKVTPELRQSYADYFERVFFGNPWLDEALPSFVHEEASGKITGFLGVLPRRMSLGGESISVALSSQFIVDPSSRASGAGVRLLKTFLTGPQHLSITDEANNISRRLWEGLGGSTALLYSIHWTRLLRPARVTVSRIGQHARLPFLAPASKPLCSLMDAVLARRLPHRFRQTMPEVSAEELGTDTLLTCLSEFSNTRMLWPELDARSLKWLLETIERKGDQGSLRKLAIRNAKREIIGWYLYQLNPEGLSKVVQLMAKRNSINEVLDHLFYDAWQHGSTVISGRLDPQFMQAFSDKHCLFDCGAPWMLIHSYNPEILRAFHYGDALLSSLEGELCMRFK
jgi:hypothetical protein